jgi:hypothetical protein
MIIRKAKELRNPEELRKVPGDRPGWYRWWAPRQALKLLLGDFYDGLVPIMTRGKGELEGLSCIYVGVAINESIRKRLDWHINQKHTPGNIKHGTLSTLRQSISSLVGKSQQDENATNDLIDLLMVEIHPVQLEIKSGEALDKIRLIEDAEIQRDILPLNISKNRRPHIADFKKYLKAKRKKAKGDQEE